MKTSQVDFKRRSALVSLASLAVMQLVTLPTAAQNNTSGVVVILAFTAFGCGFSEQADNVLRLLKTKYGSKVQIRYKLLPLDENERTLKLHQAALFAERQGMMNEAVTLLHANSQAAGNDTSIPNMLDKLGLSYSDWQATSLDGKLRRQLENDILDAQALKVQATPTFYIGGYKLEGLQRQEVMEQIIDFQLASQVRNLPIEQLLGTSSRKKSALLESILAK